MAPLGNTGPVGVGRPFGVFGAPDSVMKSAGGVGSRGPVVPLGVGNVGDPVKGKGERKRKNHELS